jgi:Flp pilus assembly protein TadD
MEQKGSAPGTSEPVRQPTRSLVNDISRQAEQQIQRGQLETAAQTLERGLRIAPKNASLWSHLATVRLQQHRYGQALALAAKSNTLAGGNSTLMRRNRLIIEEAQRAGQ